MKMVSRSMLAAVALAYGVVATAPALAASPIRHETKVCIHLLKLKCFKL
ncbi:MAG TPA: hypothetical protein VHU23_02875 [Rhizomicrobium sp.]|jgi:hypothetical protein|nr:hypothetical protein [Rhizomicrobium sp.]